MIQSKTIDTYFYFISLLKGTLSDFFIKYDIETGHYIMQKQS